MTMDLLGDTTTVLMRWDCVLNSFVLNGFYGVLRGQIYNSYLNNRILKGRYIAEKVRYKYIWVIDHV